MCDLSIQIPAYPVRDVGWACVTCNSAMCSLTHLQAGHIKVMHHVTVFHITSADTYTTLMFGPRNKNPDNCRHMALEQDPDMRASSWFQAQGLRLRLGLALPPAASCWLRQWRMLPAVAARAGGLAVVAPASAGPLHIHILHISTSFQILRTPVLHPTPSASPQTST